jgi:hypothetical protein
MELICYSRRSTNIFEKLEASYSLKDDIILKNIKLYNEEYLQMPSEWGKLITENKKMCNERERWINVMIQIMDEFEFSFETCEIAIQIMDIFIGKKLKKEKDTKDYELYFMREPFEEWVEKPEEITVLLAVIISLSGKYQELQMNSNIMIKGVDKKKMGKGEYEMMDYMEYLVPYKTPSFFIHLYSEDFFDPEKIMFYTFRITDELYKYVDYIMEKHTLLSFSILKYVIQDLFHQSFLIPLWEEKVKRHIMEEDDRSSIERIYKKIQHLLSVGFVENLHKEYRLSKISVPIQNIIPNTISGKEEAKIQINYHDDMTQMYLTPKNIKIRFILKVKESDSWNPPLKKQKALFM